jgi:ABC-type sulfate transport system permease component
MRTFRGGWPFALAALLFVVAVAGPVVAVLTSVTPGEAMAAFASPYARGAVETSLRASLAATFVATLLGVPAGYYLARGPSGVRGALVFALALPLALPPVASGIILLSVVGERAPLGAWFAAHGIAIPDSQAGVALAEFFVSGSFIAIAATAAFSALDPIYEDAARTLGAGELRIFARVALPAAAANIAIGIAFAWLRAIGEYGATSVLAYHPTSLPVALYVALSSSGVQAALALTYGFVVLAAAVLLVQWVLRRRVVE